MRSLLRGLMAALLLLSTSVASAADSTRYLDEVFPRISTVSDIAYGEATGANGEKTKLLLDLYAPEDDTEQSRPVILFIHGGGFFMGNKMHEAMVTLAKAFAHRGYVTLSMNYRLMPSWREARANLGKAMGMAVEDAKTALKWVDANQATYRMDPARLAIGGGSAGAFTSLAAAYNPGKDKMGDVRIRAVIDFWGGVANPKVMEPGDPPLIIIHGTSDPVVTFRYAERLNARAKEAGVPCEFHPLPGAGHAAWEQIDEYIAWIAPFLYQHVINAK